MPSTSHFVNTLQTQGQIRETTLCGTTKHSENVDFLPEIGLLRNETLTLRPGFLNYRRKALGGLGLMIAVGTTDEPPKNKLLH